MAEITLTSENFEEEVLHADKTVLVDFWATWCGPCRMLAPIIAEIAEEREDTLKVGKVNVDEAPELAAAFGIASIPTVIVFKEGKPVKKSIGYCPKEEIEALL
ncbi:MAG: thioredoxin [Clostridia bacterium]|nr:thioredoxin [Clostridia bacterium]